MSKSKPSRRRKPDQDAKAAEPVDEKRGNPQIAAIAAALALIIVVALVYLLKRSGVQDAPTANNFAATQVNPPPGPVRQFAGPAAFTFTLENAALSPDGRVTAWSYAAGDVVMCIGVWGGAEPDLSQQITLSGANSAVRDLAFSAQGEMLAAARADGTVSLWDVASGQPSVALEGHTDEVTAVAFSPDGVSMATGSRDSTIRLWDSFGGLPMVTLDGHSATVNALAYSSDGSLLASASDDQTVRIWDMETGSSIHTVDLGAGDAIRAMVLSPTQPLLMTSDGTDTVWLWNFETGKQVGRLVVPEGEVLSAAFAPDGSAIAVAGVDGKVIVRSLRGGEVLADLQAPHTPMFVQFAVDGSLLWSRFSTDHLRQIGAASLLGKIATATQAAEKAIVGFGIPEGVTVELFADESMVANPASICQDEQGRLYVAETFRYDTEVGLGYAGREYWLLDDLANQTVEDRLAMYEKHQDQTSGGLATHSKYSERIRQLEDSDGDGRADKVSLFADGFDTPLTGTGSGLIARDGDLYYTCIPDLWMFRDEDDDGVADRRDRLLSGFGVNASLPHDLHGLVWGPDGKLYFSVGDRGLHVETTEGNTIHQPAVGAVMRCNPDGSELEVIAKGFRNPQELAFDQFGNLFTVDNNSNQGDQARLMYIVPGAECGWQMSYETMSAEFPLGPWNMDKMWETTKEGRAAWVLPPIANIGIGPSGLAYYPYSSRQQADESPKRKYEGQFFLCDFADTPEVSGVRAFAVEPSGAGFTLRDQQTFLSNILPTDIEFGLDEKIYISDWIRGADSDGLGRIYAASIPAEMDIDQAKQTQRLLAGGIRELDIDGLVELLSHDDMRVRQRAQFRLADQGSDAIEQLQVVADSGDRQLARIHAVWALGMIGREDDAAHRSVAPLLNDPDAEIRAQVARVLGDGQHQESASDLVKGLGDDNPRVRSFVAQALGQLRHADAVEAMVEMLRENADADPFLRHVATNALFQIGDADAVAAFAEDSDRSVRLAVLLALRRFRDPRIAQFLDDSDSALIVEAARAIHDLPIDSALEQLAMTLNRGDASEALLRRSINASLRLGQADHARMLTELIGDSDASNSMKRVAIDALGDWLAPPVRDRVLGDLRPLPERDDKVVENVIAPWMSKHLADPESEFQQPIMTAAAKLEIAVGDASWVTDTRRAVDVRELLLTMMSQRRDRELRQAIDDVIESDEPRLRVHAAKLLIDLDPFRAIGVLRSIISSGTVDEQQTAFTALESIALPEADSLLAEWLVKLQAGEVPPAIKYEVMSAANTRSSPLVQQQLASVLSYLAQQPTIAGRYQAVLEGGSAERGRLLFENHTGIQCLRCHEIDGKGGKVGPDLSKIGGRVTREYLLESLLAPELTLAKGYEGVLIATIDGNVFTGTLAEENDSLVRIIEGDGNEREIAKDQIEHRQGGKSVMPGDLLQQISSSDVRDLVEYLASLK